MCQTDLKVSSEKADMFLKKCYEIYSDYALKNPFYSLEMPIRAGKDFEKKVLLAREKRFFLNHIISLKLLKQVKIENKTSRQDFLTRRKPHFVVFKRFSAFLDLFDIHLKSSIDAIDRPILRT